LLYLITFCFTTHAWTIVVFLKKLNFVACPIKCRCLLITTVWLQRIIFFLDTCSNIRALFVTTQNSGHRARYNHLFKSFDFRLKILDVLMNSTVITCCVCIWSVIAIRRKKCWLNLMKHLLTCYCERFEISVSTVLGKSALKKFDRRMLKF
jgi:hypothetical protein